MSWKALVASNIKVLKREKGWTQDKLAEEASCSKGVVRDLEAGNGSASIDMLSKIAEALGVTASDLLKDPNIKTTSAPRLTVKGLASKMVCIPDEVYDLAEKIGNNEKAWADIKSVMRAYIPEAKEKKA